MAPKKKRRQTAAPAASACASASEDSKVCHSGDLAQPEPGNDLDQPEPAAEDLVTAESHEVEDEEAHPLMEEVTPVTIPVVASSRAPRSVGKFDKDGHKQIVNWIAGKLANLPPDVKHALKKLHGTRPTLSTASVCSGTDVPVMVVQAYKDAIARPNVLQKNPMPMSLHHAFSCEKNASCHAFVQPSGPEGLYTVCEILISYN